MDQEHAMKVMPFFPVRLLFRSRREVPTNSIACFDMRLLFIFLYFIQYHTRLLRPEDGDLCFMMFVLATLSV